MVMDAKRWTGVVATAILALNALIVPVCEACSYFEVKYGKGDDYLIGRSMELGGTVLESLWMIKAVPKGWKYPFHPLPVVDVDLSDNDAEISSIGLRGGSETLEFAVIEDKLPEQEHKFAAKHGFVANMGDLRLFGITIEDLVIDGMNEHGLAMSGHTFLNARYPRAEDDTDGSKTEIQYFAFIPYVLGQYASVAELKADLPNLLVTSTDSIPTSLGLHWSVADRSGASVVLEFMNGKLNVHENTVGVMTNDPPFDYHLFNLNQYTMISPSNPDRKSDIGEIETEIGPVPKATNHGFNTVGLPGDSTPAGRFTKLFFYKEIVNNVSPAKDEAEAIQVATHVLNSVDIPMGVLAKESHSDPGDYTQWVIIKNPISMKYMYRSYSNMQWHSIDMSKLGGFFTSRSEHPKALHMFTSATGIIDVTDDLIA